MPELTNCIYCSETFDPGKGEGDHIIPAALGEFRDLARFRGICVPCNNTIGASEQQLLRCGPEAYLARLSEPPIRRRQRIRSWPGAMGAPPPVMHTERDGARLLVRPIAGNPSSREILDQIVVEDATGTSFQIPIFAGMSAESIRERIHELAAAPPLTIHYNISTENHDWFMELIKTLWPDSPVVARPTIQPGIYPSWGPVTFRVTDHYFRAIAKLGFHYLLAYSSLGLSGREAEFEGLRTFILNGGDVEEFVRPAKESPVRFELPFGQRHDGRIAMPAHWCHFLAASDAHEELVACVRLFLGPACVLPPHYVVLGKRPQSAAAGRAWAHKLTWTPGSEGPGATEFVELHNGETGLI